MPHAVETGRLGFERGGVRRLSEAVARLEAMGYERCPSVLDVAQFAVRGGIIDLYGFGMPAPARVEWLGDEITSVRTFDLDTQRSEKEIEEATALPVAARADERISGWADKTQTGDSSAQPLNRSSVDRRSLLDLLPPDSIVVATEGVELADIGRGWDEAVHHIEVARRRGEDVPGRESILLDPGVWAERWGRYPLPPSHLQTCLSRPCCRGQAGYKIEPTFGQGELA